MMAMRIAYADPPYIGCANRYPEKTEVDHIELIARLYTFDGWALSASSPSLYDILPLLPERERIGSWRKPFAIFKPNVNPAYAWEPIIWRPARRRTREQPTVRDWIAENITLKRGLVGVKPEKVCHWMFDVLGAHPSDEFHDLYPGTGAVTHAWESWCAEQRAVA